MATKKISKTKKTVYSKEDREALINNLSNTDSTVKKIMKKESNTKKVTERSEGSSKTTRNRSSSTEEILVYEIDENSGVFVSCLKEIINELGVSKQFIYDRMLELYPDEYDGDPDKARGHGYNMIYSLRDNKISEERFSRWLELLGIVNFKFTYDLKDIKRY